ncbi:hypothetical protein BJV78DRAFT_1159397, partial [Lactifluus subvellereus]
MIGSRSDSIALFQGTDQNWFGNARRLHAAGPADRHPLSPPTPADTPHATFGSRTLMPLTAKILPAMSPSPPWNDVIIAESVVASHLVPVLCKRTIPLLDATELSPLRGHHGIEIASIDVKTGHIACFGDGNGAPGGPRAVRWSVRGDCDEYVDPIGPLRQAEAEIAMVLRWELRPDLRHFASDGGAGHGGLPRSPKPHVQCACLWQLRGFPWSQVWTMVEKALATAACVT